MQPEANFAERRSAHVAHNFVKNTLTTAHQRVTTSFDSFPSIQPKHAAKITVGILGAGAAGVLLSGCGESGSANDKTVPASDVTPFTSPTAIVREKPVFTPTPDMPSVVISPTQEPTEPSVSADTELRGGLFESTDYNYTAILPEGYEVKPDRVISSDRGIMGDYFVSEDGLSEIYIYAEDRKTDASILGYLGEDHAKMQEWYEENEAAQVEWYSRNPYEKDMDSATVDGRDGYVIDQGRPSVHANFEEYEFLTIVGVLTEDKIYHIVQKVYPTTPENQLEKYNNLYTFLASIDIK